MHTGPIASHMTPPGINLKWHTPIRQGNRSRSRSRSVQHPSMEDKPNHPPKSHSFSGDPPCASFVTFIIHFIYSFFLYCCSQCFRSKRIWLPGTHTLPIAWEKIKLFASLLCGAQKHFMHLWHPPSQPPPENQPNFPLFGQWLFRTRTEPSFYCGPALYWLHF